MGVEKQRWIPVGSGDPPEFVDFNGVDRIEYREATDDDPEKFVLLKMSGGKLCSLGEVFETATIEHLKMEVGLKKRDMHFFRDGGPMVDGASGRSATQPAKPIRPELA